MSDGDKSGPDEKAIVRELAALLDETGLSEIEVEREGVRVRVVKHGAPPPAAAAPPPPAGAGTPPTQAAVAHPGTVTSPLVGTVYLAAQPGGEPFIAVGDTVKEGQTVLIVEAMKTMNPIAAPRSGKVLEILVRDGQPVEFGEALLVIA